jgi:hypothetical protein
VVPGSGKKGREASDHATREVMQARVLTREGRNALVNLQDESIFLTRAAEELQNYLLSEQVFWPLGLGTHMEVSQLTPGNLLLCERKIQCLSPGTFSSLIIKTEQTRLQWKSHWQQKAAREFLFRLKQWQEHFTEQGKYAQIVRDRVILELLQEEIETVKPGELDLLFKLDELVRSQTIPASFIWEPELEGIFSKEKFWFLYVNYPTRRQA